MWHVSTSLAPSFRLYGGRGASLTARGFLRRAAEEVLAGVGNATLGQWEEWNAAAGVLHLKRRLSAAEQELVGEPRDIRGTPEEREIMQRLARELPPERRRLLPVFYR